MLLKYKHPEEFKRVDIIINNRLVTGYYAFILFSLTIIAPFSVALIDIVVNSLGYNWFFIVYLGVVSYLFITSFYIRKSIGEVRTILGHYMDYDENYDNIDMILHILEALIIFLRNDSFYSLLITKKEKNELLNWIHLILGDLKIDLSYQVNQVNISLTQAKSSLSTHIHGTDALNHISDLQQSRLDKQIEQFEELQRVLVRV